MSEFGSNVLLLTLIIVGYSCFALFYGGKTLNKLIYNSGLYAYYSSVILLFINVITLIVAFLNHDFSISYVAGNSNYAMDKSLIWVAFYAGNEGSLLFIASVLSIVSFFAIYLGNKRVELTKSMPFISGILAVLSLFFVAILYFLANPFAPLDFVPADGRGINPLLTHFGMFIHPPVMMTGLVSIAIPFSIAMGATIGKAHPDSWTNYARLWGLISFMILGSGLLLGSWWAYTILGWGGYWGWDPIENVGFMPFLVLTGFIHTIVVQKKRGIFRFWNLILISLAFNLGALGMFFNRAGPVPSVHSFGESTIGWSFLTFFVISVFFSVIVLAWRYKQIKGVDYPNNLLSRTMSFVVNNFLLLCVTFITLWGIMFPIISDVFTGTTITVGAPFYNQTNGPLLLVLIFAMGLGPMLPWGKLTKKMALNILLTHIVPSLVCLVILFILGIRNIYALISFSLCCFVVIGIFKEWFIGVKTRFKRGDNIVIGFFKLIMNNRSRYGGYITHLSIVLLALAVTGSTFFNIERNVIIEPGAIEKIGKYELQYSSTVTQEYSDRVERTALITASVNGRNIGVLKAENHYYPSFQMASTRSGIMSFIDEDLYVIPQEFLSDGRVALRLLVNPMMVWMWIAGPIFILGTVISFWPTIARKEDS